MSSMDEGPQVQVQRDTRASSPGYGRFIAPAVVAIVIVILILQNTGRTGGSTSSSGGSRFRPRSCSSCCSPSAFSSGWG